jgi:hypothetical protein
MIFSHPLIAPALDLGAADPEVRLRAVRQFISRLADPGFLATLRQHRLTPLLYSTLTQFPREEVGAAPLLGELRRDYLEKLGGYKVQERETRRLAEALAQAGVEGILLKGGDIRHRLYDDPVSRPMGDVDILISPADLDRARAVLKGRGYPLTPKDVDRIPDFNRRFSWEELYGAPRGCGVYFDIHWEIRKMGAFYRLPYAPLHARATPGPQGWGPLLILAPEHLLMNLCLNTLEEWEQAGVMKAVDLDRALSRLPLNWDFFLEDAARFQIQGALFLILRYLAALRPGAAPGWVLARLAAYRPGWGERLILSRRSGSLLGASLATLGRHLPVRDWPAFLRGKLWPDRAFLQANRRTYPSRLGYVRHLFKRTQDKT